jgi:hypothetical protein
MVSCCIIGFLIIGFCGKNPERSGTIDIHVPMSKEREQKSPKK